jgi:thymidylate kinase
MFEGIDGSGKTTLAGVFAQELARLMGFTIFDVQGYCQREGKLPAPWPTRNELLFTAEPTRAWVGAAIRGELIRNGTDYPPETVAEAFALDRELLYTRLLVPMLGRDAVVIQDRGLPSSMTYQPIMENGVPLEKLLALRGNALALEHAPKHLIIARCSVGKVMERLAERTEKKDDSIFEREAFLTKLAQRYEADWFKRTWEERGTIVHYLDADAPLDEATTETEALADELAAS